MKKPRLGFLGTGWIGRHRMEAVIKSGMAEAACVSDQDEQALAAARQSAPDARVVGSLDEMLDAGLDGVVIATPSALHAEQSLQAFRRGVAVFCQKPLGRNSEEVARVIGAAREADRLLGVDFSYRHTEGMRRIRQVILEGGIGDVYAVDLIFHNAYGPDKPWFYDPALSGGGCVMDLGVHLVDLALWMMDFPEVTGTTSRLFAQGRPLESLPPQVEDYGTARIDVSTGATISLACSWRLPAGCDAVISATFYGTNGGVELRNVNGSFYDFVAERFMGTSRETLCGPPDEWGGRAAVDWARRLGAGARYDAEADRLLDVARVLDSIYGRFDFRDKGALPTKLHAGQDPLRAQYR